MVTLQSRVSPADSVLFQDLDGEAVLLELTSGTYFGLDLVGTRFWQVLDERKRLDLSLEVLLAEFDVSEEQLRSDLVEFVETLCENRLLEVDGK